MKKQELTARFVEHLERERIIAGLTQTQMAEHLELSLSGYKKIISGETARIDLYTAYRLGQFTGRSIAEFFEETDSELTRTIRKLRQLSPFQFNFVSAVINFETAFLGCLSPGASPDYITLLTPTGNLHDGMIWDAAHMEKLNVSHYRRILGDKLHCAIRITSNHLHPAYNINDILLISKTAPRDGDIGIFIHKETHRCYLRKFRQASPWILEPVNHYGISFKIDCTDSGEIDKWIVFGKVLTKMRMDNG